MSITAEASRVETPSTGRRRWPWFACGAIFGAAVCLASRPSWLWPRKPDQDPRQSAATVVFADGPDRDSHDGDIAKVRRSLLTSQRVLHRGLDLLRDKVAIKGVRGPGAVPVEWLRAHSRTRSSSTMTRMSSRSSSTPRPPPRPASSSSTPSLGHM